MNGKKPLGQKLGIPGVYHNHQPDVHKHPHGKESHDYHPDFSLDRVVIGRGGAIESDFDSMIPVNTRPIDR